MQKKIRGIYLCLGLREGNNGRINGKGWKSGWRNLFLDLSASKLSFRSFAVPRGRAGRALQCRSYARNHWPTHMQLELHFHSRVKSFASEFFFSFRQSRLRLASLEYKSCPTRRKLRFPKRRLAKLTCKSQHNSALYFFF